MDLIPKFKCHFHLKAVTQSSLAGFSAILLNQKVRILQINISTSSTNLTFHQGTYCPRESPAPTPCPAGTYNDVEMGVANDVCKNCSANTYNFFTVSYVMV